ncbi:pyridoxamine 5'-phosphate oxidase family protein [Allorhizobium pseudoryzae]|uniref:pyridoxamine 5'-phosphate oxidase family protein n=1 Tax=Allorhizobium pseudoryzae TaxID=379684 RepID=UPI003CFD794C
MGLVWKTIPEEMQEFIRLQKVFFVASAPLDGRVNVSPKGLDTLKIIDERTVAYLDLTGSGNETAAHVLENGRMTMMFLAFSGDALILRLYGQAELIRPDHNEWHVLLSHFGQFPGIRQIFRLSVDRVSSSCGWSVPIFGEATQRDELTNWSTELGESGLAAFRDDKNVVSIDGLTTGYASDDF